MHLLASDRSIAAAQAAAVTLLTVGALVLLAVVLANWTWQWLAPLPEAGGQPVVQASARATSGNGLFGKVRQDEVNAATTGSDIKLLGIVAATRGRSGYAVLRTDAKTVLSVREGEGIAAGLRLAEVAGDHVILERGGVRQKLGWPIKGPATEPPFLRTGK